jgi:hypothetical protein
LSETNLEKGTFLIQSGVCVGFMPPHICDGWRPGKAFHRPNKIPCNIFEDCWMERDLRMVPMTHK